MEGLKLSLVDALCDDALADCMKVMVRAFEPQYGEAWTQGQLRSMMSLPGALLVIGRLGDRPVSFGLMRAIVQEAELLLLAVDPDHRSVGHGRRILDRCLTLAEGRGARSVFLEVRAGNPATHLYRKAGFNQYNIRKKYYKGHDGESFDALSFRLSLAIE